MYDFLQKLKTNGHSCTLLGIGPVSKSVIKATFEAALQYSFPPVFIASRNQVDLKSLGHGYLMGGMDQFDFVRTLKKIRNDVGYEGPLYICRDHGGPWQRNMELDNKYSLAKAMEIARLSFKADIEAGFNYLHIDPTKCPHSFSQSDLCDWTIELVEYCEQVRKQLGRGKIDYEVGTEDIQGGLTTKEAFAYFLKELTGRLSESDLPNPACVVGQTGTLTRLNRNVGRFDRRQTETLAEIAAAYNIGFKEHNGDYLGAADCSIHPEIGVAGVNVAPEFGLVETDGYLFLADLENKAVEQGLITTGESSGLKNLLIEKTFKISPWRKWLTHDLKELPAAEVEGDGSLRLLIARVCGHYVYDDPQVAAARDQLFKNSRRFNLVEDPEQFVIEKLLRAIGFYVKHFRMEGINRIAGRD